MSPQQTIQGQTTILYQTFPLQEYRQETEMLKLQKYLWTKNFLIELL